MSVKMRQEVERKIVTAAVEGILAQGWFISIPEPDGGGGLITCSNDKERILENLFLCDEERIWVHNKNNKYVGWVLFIYGNDGWDVINDYIVTLEEALTEANRLAEEYS